HQILRGLATADEELSAAVSARYDARQGRQVCSQVGRYVGRGDELNILRPDSLVTGRDARRPMLPFGPNEDLGELLLVRFQAHGNGADLVRRNLQRVSMGAIPDEGDLQQVGAGLDPPDDVHAVGIRCRAVEWSAFESGACFVERDGRTIERTSI